MAETILGGFGAYATPGYVPPTGLTTPGTLYTAASGPLRLNGQEFRFTALRPDLGDIPLDGIITGVEWRDEGTVNSVNEIAILRGTLTLSKAGAEQSGALVYLHEGYRIRCEVLWGGQWAELWEMRLRNEGVQLQDGGWTFELADDLEQAGLSEDFFRYRRGKVAKPKGWRYDEIVRDVCKKYKMPVGQVVKGTHRLKNIEEKTSPLSIIRQAVEAERTWSGRRLVIVWRYSPKARKYALHVVPMRRNPLLYILREQIVGGSIETTRNAQLATVVTARGSGYPGAKKDAKGHYRHSGKKKTFKTRVIADGLHGRPNGVAQYGWIHRTYNAPGNIDSVHELKDRAERYLARVLEPVKKVELTHPGIAFMRRGDAIEMVIPDEGYKGGKESVAYVVSIAHSLSSGSYTMQLTLSFKDPLDPKTVAAEMAAAIRARKAAAKVADDDSSSSDSVTGARAGSPVANQTSVSGIHETDGLAGYPAKDYFAPSGSTAVAPVSGTIARFSGHDPAGGPVDGPHGPLGWSIYLNGSDGKSYYLTHLGSRTVYVGQKVTQGQKIGTVADYAKYGTPSHIHMGISG